MSVTGFSMASVSPAGPALSDSFFLVEPLDHIPKESHQSPFPYLATSLCLTEADHQSPAAEVHYWLRGLIYPINT